MAPLAPKVGRRTDALSKARIVEAALAILDAEGEDALTFRALAARLATGSGALYGHVADKAALLEAAADAAMLPAVSTAAEGAAGAETGLRAAIRAVALAAFDAVYARPWLGAQLSRDPAQPAMLRLYEALGGPLMVPGVPEAERFDAWSALTLYVLGAAAQSAARGRDLPPGTDRAALLAATADRWSALDPQAYPFGRWVAARLRDHDDRAQFLAGVDLILAGIEAGREVGVTDVTAQES